MLGMDFRGIHHIASQAVPVTMPSESCALWWGLLSILCILVRHVGEPCDMKVGVGMSATMTPGFLVDQNPATSVRPKCHWSMNLYIAKRPRNDGMFGFDPSSSSRFYTWTFLQLSHIYLMVSICCLLSKHHLISFPPKIYPPGNQPWRWHIPQQLFGDFPSELNLHWSWISKGLPSSSTVNRHRPRGWKMSFYEKDAHLFRVYVNLPGIDNCHDLLVLRYIPHDPMTHMLYGIFTNICPTYCGWASELLHQLV